MHRHRAAHRWAPGRAAIGADLREDVEEAANPVTTIAGNGAHAGAAQRRLARAFTQSDAGGQTATLNIERQHFGIEVARVAGVLAAADLCRDRRRRSDMDRSLTRLMQVE